MIHVPRALRRPGAPGVAILGFAPDGQFLGSALVETRLQGGRGPKVRVSGGGAIVE